MTGTSIPIERDNKSLSWVASCPDCKECVFMLTDEAVAAGPRRSTGSSLLLPITMRAPHICKPPSQT